MKNITVNLKMEVRNRVKSLFTILFFLIFYSAFGQTSEVFDLPDNCKAKDLTPIGAFISGIPPCIDCENPPEDAEISLILDNGTGSLRQAFAFWAVLEVTVGNDTESNYVYGCVGPVPPSKETTLPVENLIFYDENGDVIPGKEFEYICGSSLKLTDIIFAWTPASDIPPNQCPITADSVNSKCDSVAELVIDTPLTGAVDNIVDNVCYGDNLGAIEISPIGGVSPFTYDWADLPGTDDPEDRNNLAAGDYTVVIKDSENCTVELMATVEEPDILDATVTGSDVTCNGGTDGSISVTAPSGGSGNYEYSNDGGTSWQNTGSFTGLSAGTYEVFIRDADEPTCYIDLGDEVIDEPDILDATVTGSDVTCNGGTDGSISVTAPSGGSGNYEYSNDGGTSWQNTGSFTGLSAGTYEVFIRDADEPTCYIDLGDEVIDEPDILDATVTGSDVTCNGGTDGSISVTAPSGGSGNYEYSNDGGTSWQNTGSFTGLSAGTYEVFIRDADEPTCYIDLGDEVIDEPDILDATVTGSDVTCNGGTDGSISVTAPSGGSGNYEYSNDGGTSWQNTGSFTGLSAGTYEVFIRDADEPTCYIDLGDEVIDEPDILDATVTGSDVTCNGGTDGSISVTAPSGGSGNYEYSNDGGTSWQNTGSFTGLSAGTYEVFIRDADEPTCYIDLGDEVIDEPDILDATVTGSDVTCNGGTDGSISVTAPSGGSGNYEYSNDGGTSWQNTGSFTGLSAGTYEVFIRDADEPTCYIDLGDEVIDEPDILDATVTGSDVTCNGGTDGSISVTAPSGGSGNYEYSNDGGTSWQNTGSFTGLSAGTYEVFIRDADEPTCYIDLGDEVIDEPDILDATVTGSDVTCNGGTDGSISVTAPSGGSGNYEYSNDGGTSWQNTGSFTGLSAGTYEVFIRDADEPTCYIDLGDEVIDEPDILDATVTGSDVTCNGGTDGSISVTAPSGGSGNYEYSNDGGTSWQNTGSFTGLSAGTYEVFIRDADEPTCYIDLGDEVIDEPDILDATVTGSDVTCNGGTDGSISVTAPSGGSGNYEYSNDGGTSWQNTGSFTGLSAGTYEVFIRDADEPTCYIDLGDEVIDEPDVLDADLSSTDEDCAGNSGTISITNPSGGSGSYEYSIDAGVTWQSGGSFNNLTADTYEVFIRDANATSCIIDLGDEIVDPAFNCDHIFPTQTDCKAYSDNIDDLSAIVLDAVCLTQNGNFVSNATPGVFFYFGDWTATSTGKVTIDIVQTRDDLAVLTPFLVVNSSNVKVQTFGDCADIKKGTRVTIETDKGKPTGNVSVTFNAIADVRYVISVKYDVKSLVGSGYGEATYTFGMQTGGGNIPGSYGQISAINCNPSSAGTLVDETSALKSSFAIEEESSFSVAPVPFKDQVSLRYEFDYTSDVKIQFFDLNGSLLRTYADKQVTNGDITQINIDFALKANQVYILRVETDRDSFSKQVMSGN